MIDRDHRLFVILFFFTTLSIHYTWWFTREQFAKGSFLNVYVSYCFGCFVLSQYYSRKTRANGQTGHMVTHVAASVLRYIQIISVGCFGLVVILSWFVHYSHWFVICYLNEYIAYNTYSVCKASPQIISAIL